MDMATKHPDQLAFHLTGKRHGDELDPIDGLGLRPALMAGFRDLTRLRYDFPVVLVEGTTGADCARSLSGVVDDVLREVAPRGVEGERLRRHGLQVEREIRVLLREGASGRLSELWEAAAKRVSAHEGETLEQVLMRTGESIDFDGPVADCDHALPERFVTHAWAAHQEGKARRFRADVGHLVIKLTDILRAAFSHSEAGRRPASLKAAVGGPHRNQFNFDALSRVLGKGAPADELPPARRQRIEWSLGVLKSQRFYALEVPSADAEPVAADPGTLPYEFAFRDCASAEDAFRSRMPAAVELFKAMAIAELEIDGRYKEGQDDTFFAEYGVDSVSPEDFAALPDYLVCLDSHRASGTENATLMELLSSHVPIKVLVQTEELFEEASLAGGHFAFGVRSTQLAGTVVALNDAFVLQTVSSNLYEERQALLDGLAYRGPALFSVYSGAAAPASGLASYLTAAAAMQSRAFPSFVYRPDAGRDLASRYSLEGNPQPEGDWPVEAFEYSDDKLQRVTELQTFTFADFVSCDLRYARHFARVPRAHWSAQMVPADVWLALNPQEAADKVPYILAVDGEDALQRVIVDARVMQGARRCLEGWHRRQELCGVNNSYARQLLAREKAAWEEQKKREIEALKGAAVAAAAAAPAGAAAPAASAAPEASAPSAPAAAAEPERNPDEAWIDTGRCPSCGECRNINDKMFGYNDNKQAFIADLKAGSFKQLVEAAESCQVAIIHPGKPWDPKEAGLDELMKRAEAFQ